MNTRYEKKGTEKRASIVPAKKKHLKRAIIVAGIVLGALILLCAALFALQTALQKSRPAEILDSGKAPSIEGKNYLSFYEPDYDADIFADADYLEKDRAVRYTVPKDAGGVTVVLDEYEMSELTEGGRFFLTYFDALAHGDYESYRAFFTPEYKENPNGFEKFPNDRTFPMQRVYDITVTELGKSDPNDKSFTYNGEPCVYGVYDVRYKILKNDGELRHDLAENGEVPLVFETVTLYAGTEDEVTYIQNLYRYTDIASDQK